MLWDAGNVLGRCTKHSGTQSKDFWTILMIFAIFSVTRVTDLGYFIAGEELKMRFGVTGDQKYFIS